MKRIYNKLSLLDVWPMKWRLARYAWPANLYVKAFILASKREFFYKDCSPERLVWVGYRLWKTKVLEIFSLLFFLLLPLPSMAYVEVQDRYFLHEVSEASDEILDNLAILDLSEKMLKVAIKEGDYEKADLLEKYIEISMKNIRELMKK